MAVAIKVVVVLMLAFALLAMAQAEGGWEVAECYNDCVDNASNQEGVPICVNTGIALPAALLFLNTRTKGKVMQNIEKGPTAPASKAPTSTPSKG